MANKRITPEGKTKMLQYALGTEDGSFKYLALGDGQSSGATENGNFSELTDNEYHRVPFETQVSSNDSRSITLTGIFDDNNYNPVQGGYVSEIAIVNNDRKDASDVFFAYAEIPKILKSDNISLKYTIVISVL